MITYINPDAIEEQSIDWSKLKPANVTYEELVALRNNSQLNPGQQYRITDYITTTTQSNTQSAEHPFDVIVIADDVDVLNENARAIQREGDTYFANSDLNAWELKYCLDNDTSRFAWADATNGKGVIYYMKDEWNNECPYDFKNILFKRNINDSVIYCYTFGKDTDYSISGYNYGNVIKEYKNGKKITLNNIVFLGPNCYSNTFGNNCYSNSFGEYCSYNSFGNGCYSNSFGNDCHNNSFGNNCYSNTFDYNCSSNSFGNDCYSNSFGNDCHNNSFGNNCYSNSFSEYCSYNSFGNYCTSNSFGEYCSYNSFGNSCYRNSFGNDCHNNSFGDNCHNNSFGNGCYSNSFGNGCYSNSFRLGSSINDTLLNYCQYNHFDDGCSYNVIWNSVQPTNSNKLQNINIVRGVSGKSSVYNFINIVEKNANHEIKVAKNTNGEIKIYCEADLTKLLSSLDSDGCLTLYHE